MRSFWWIAIGLMMWSSSTAADELDLVSQQKNYGFQGVAMIVGTYETSDQSAGVIQKLMSEGGLGQLTMPLSVGKRLASEIKTFGDVGRCAWQFGVFCHVDVEWKTGPPVHWTARCLKGTKRVKGVALTTVIVPKEVGGRGDVQIDGIQACWASGGDGIRLVVK